MTGVELLRHSQAIAPHAIRMVLTAYTDVDSLMEAINTGRIYHFIPKPWDPNELLVVVRRAAERYELARENARLKDELELACNAMQRDAAAARERPLSLEKLVGAPSGLRARSSWRGGVLESDTTVLLLGEDRHGQGAVRAPDPRERARGGPPASWRRTAARSPNRCSSRAVRSRPRRLHRRDRRAQRTVRGGRRRHDLSRRGRRDADSDAVKASPRAAGRRDPPRSAPRPIAR
jgi:hypothetical protein